MNFQSNIQTDLDKLQDSLWAAIETGNTGRARQVLGHIQAEDPALASDLYTQAINDYGIVLL